MNLITLPVISLPGPPPTGPSISARSLAEYFVAKDIIDTARKEAKIIQQEAQSYLDDVKQRCEEAVQNAREEGFEQVQQEAPAIRQQLAADMVEWLVTEHALEQDIIARLEAKLCYVLTCVMDEFITGYDTTKHLIHRLKCRLESLSSEEAASLYVCPIQRDEVEKAFCAYPWIKIKNDDSVIAGEAVLMSASFTLHINLQEQFQSILSRVSTLAKKTVDDG